MPYLGMAEKKSSLTILGLSKRKALFTAIITILLAGAAAVLLGLAADFHKLFQALSRANWWWFLVCIGGEAVAYQGYNFGYRDFARAGHGPKLSWWDATRIAGIGQGAIIFGATAASLAVDFWAIHRAGAKIHEAAKRVLGLNTMEWAVLSVLAVAASIAILAGAGKGAPYQMTIAWIVGVPLCYLGALWFTSPRRVGRFTQGHRKIPPALQWSPRTWLGWAWVNFQKGFADAIGGVVVVRHIVGHPLKYKAGNGGFLVYWVGHLLCLYGAVRAFGYSIDIAPLVLAYATTFLLTILPLPAGGAGGIEVTLAYMLRLVGVPFTTAVASMLIFRLFVFWLPIIPALCFLPTIKSLNRDLPRAGKDLSTPLIQGFS
ncbi:MAG TPA: lysylphosphatidylglycerol synthase transmembrane domain-containing protein [Candidatus Saccharimonadales bacterium]|nr:lysylphosphatidylglycerol synthase transmembrane domain-containing protein [Candidatus Saccharimonadales bacterium]